MIYIRLKHNNYKKRIIVTSKIYADRVSHSLVLTPQQYMLCHYLSHNHTVMCTSLPDLPFPTAGICIESAKPLSSAHATPRAYPRTDLRLLRLWTSFEANIANIIQTAMTNKNILT